MRVPACPPGEERWEPIKSWRRTRPNTKLTRYQYTYCTPAGRPFSCVAESLEQARRRRDEWLARQEEEAS